VYVIDRRQEATMPTLVLVIRKDEDRIRASFPDYPTVVVDADTVDDVITRARDAVEEHLAALPVEERVPVPRTPADVLDEVSGPVIVKELTVVAPQGPTVRVNITIPEDLLQAVDRAAEAHGMSRSRLLAKSVEATITGRRHGGIVIPMSAQTLAAVDAAAAAHEMSRVAFLSRMVETVAGRTSHSAG
jgi:predicted RNase H-like HicB family nuclease